MESIVVYLGSDHVIQRPGFDFRQASLRMEPDHAAGVTRACAKETAGVLNRYNLNLKTLQVSERTSGACEAADDVDVLICEEYISLRSERALQQLQFVGADFVTQH